MPDLRDRVQAALGARYDIERELGRGGMAVVFAARDGELRREVAIKVLPPELGATSDLRARFTREARTAAGLSHPNIAPIYDVGEGDGLAWIVMAIVDGESISARVKRQGPLPLSVAKRVVSDVAQALAYAHARGIVHRDIKPDNILIDRESQRALVMDFGIAKARSDATDLTTPGAIVGTARYMSPEQAMGEPGVDGRSDIYALGLVAYYMLTGGHAIRGATLPAIISAHVRGVAVNFTALDRRLPATLSAALQKCVAPDPALRYTRMEDLLEQLRELGGDQPELSPAIRIFLKNSRMWRISLPSQRRRSGSSARTKWKSAFGSWPSASRAGFSWMYSRTRIATASPGVRYGGRCTSCGRKWWRNVAVAPSDRGLRWSSCWLLPPPHYSGYPSQPIRQTPRGS